MSRTYRSAGVDIDAGEALVEAIKPLARSTARPGADGSLGGFGAFFDLARTGYRDPILVATTDGVGTKLKIALAAARHERIGIDLVAMVVNDLVVQGAEPLFFLDYFASGSLHVATGRAIIAGIAEGCRQAGCALIGGETAEMPGLYVGEDYDLAGFGVGIVERGEIITGKRIAEGDIVLGIASDGLHSNGFSLVRRIIGELSLSLDAPAPFDPGSSLGTALLTPTRIYVKSCLAAARTGRVKGYAHITGGGLLENIPRILPEGLAAEIDAGAWPIPPVFRWLASEGAIAPAEMVRVFNCGIGMMAVSAPRHAGEVAAALSGNGERVVPIGRIVKAGPRAKRTLFKGLSRAWRG